jgi:hypothetical protein
LLLATNGIFYGTTESGGIGLTGACGHGCGTIFSLSIPPVTPFIETVGSNSGKVGESITILGNNLSDAGSVNFNGTMAAFTVVSSTEITTIVPTGATTGHLTVTTPSGPALIDQKIFRVEP